jgi:selenide,water dikinase
VGVISAALKGGTLAPDIERGIYGALIDSTTRLNAVGESLAAIEAVHAMTDVTGFGLLGHTLEMCCGSRLGADIRFDAVPLLNGVEELAQIPYRTGAAVRNWESYEARVVPGPQLRDWQRDLLCDPQTSGGLLVAVAPGAADAVLRQIHAAGFEDAAVIGALQEGHAEVRIG